MRHVLASAARTGLIVLAWPVWMILGAPLVAERLHAAVDLLLLSGVVAAAVMVAGGGADRTRIRPS